MAKPVRSVDDYIAAQPTRVRRTLQRVRRIVRGALPDAEEAISYGIPAYKVHGRIALFFAGWKDHYSLYPAGSRNVAAAFKKELQRYERSKGTIRFDLSKPVPAKLIERIAKYRAKEIAAKARGKP